MFKTFKKKPNILDEHLLMSKKNKESIGYITKYDGLFYENATNIFKIEFDVNSGFSIWADKKFRNGFTSLKSIIFNNGTFLRSSSEISNLSLDEVAEYIAEGCIFL